MKKYLILLLMLLASPAFAVTSPDGSIQAAVQAAMEASAKTLILPQAMMWLGSFMGLQFFITNFGLLKSGADLDAVFAKLVGSIAWFGVCFYILQNGPEFIDSVGTGILQKFMPAWISPGYIIAAISGVVIALLTTIGLTGLTVLGTGSPMIAIVVIVVLLVVIAVALGLAMKIFMLKLELGLVVMLSPLSFAFLGLSALKDQGIAPFKALISLAYRAILLGVICAAFKEVSTTTEAALDAIKWGEDPLAWVEKTQIMISSVFAYPMLGYLVYKSDSIAASLASGSTNMGTADVAGAVAAGVAAGSVAGGLAGAVGAGNPAQSMAKFMQGLLGGGGSIKDASSRGAGSTTVAPSPVASPSLSKSGGGSQSGQAGSPSATGGGQFKTPGSAMSNGDPRPVPTEGTPAENAVAMAGTAQNAADGVAAAGGSQAASDAAATAALAGGSNEAVSAAVVGAGGTVAQGAAAVTAMAVGEAGGSPAAMRAGAQAVGAGKSSAEVGQAVMDSVSPGSPFGQSSEVGAAAASASRTKPAPPAPPTPASAVPGSGDSATIGGAGTSADQNHEKLMAAIQQQGKPRQLTAMDQTKEFNRHIAEEKAATTISINANHSD